MASASPSYGTWHPTLRRWRAEILARHVTGVSNDPTEVQQRRSCTRAVMPKRR